MSAETRTCSNCDHAHQMSPLQGGGLECHGAPPCVVPVVQMTAHGPQQGAASIWPPVQPGWSCGQWAPRPVEIHGADRTKPAPKPEETRHGKA